MYTYLCMPLTNAQFVINTSSCTANERISQFVDHFLKDISPLVKSFLKDMSDFLRKLSAVGRIPPDCLLVRLDVTGLYTNIPSGEGLKASRKALDKHRQDQQEPTNVSVHH